MDKLLLTPTEAATALGIGRSKVYELMQTGQLQSVHIGACRRVPAEALTAFLEQLRTASWRLDERASAPVQTSPERRRREGCCARTHVARPVKTSERAPSAPSTEAGECLTGRLRRTTVRANASALA